MREPFERHRGTVVHVLGDGVCEGDDHQRLLVCAFCEQ
jgi:hypothetical protein